VAKVREFSNIMVIPNSSPVKSVRELIDYARSTVSGVFAPSPELLIGRI